MNSDKHEPFPPSVEALLATERAYDEEVVALRPAPGQQASAANLRRLLAGSEAVKRDHVSEPWQMLTRGRSSSHNRMNANLGEDGTNFWRRTFAPGWGMPGSDFKQAGLGKGRRG